MKNAVASGVWTHADVCLLELKSNALTTRTSLRSFSVTVKLTSGILINIESFEAHLETCCFLQNSNFLLKHLHQMPRTVNRIKANKTKVHIHLQDIDSEWSVSFINSVIVSALPPISSKNFSSLVAHCLNGFEICSAISFASCYWAPEFSFLDVPFSSYKVTFRYTNQRLLDSNSTSTAATILQQLWFSRLLYTDASTNSVCSPMRGSNPRHIRCLK